MKKILVVGYTNNMGGLESFILNYYRNINKKEIQFEFIVHYDEVPYEEEIKNMGGVIWRIPRKSNDLLNYKKEMKKFFNINSSKYCAIWVNVCSLSNDDYIKYAKKYGIPKRIIHSHNTNETRGWTRKIAHYINRFFLPIYATDYWACSNEAGKWFYSKRIMDNDKYEVINNAINVQDFAFDKKLRDECRNELEIDDKFVIGHVGRFCDQKNHEFLIEIFYKYYQKNNNAHLLLIGIGELENKIREKVTSLGLERSITFLGVRNDVKKLMQAMDIFMLPSLYEGLPIVGVEAQMSGLYCLFSNTITKEIKITANSCFLDLNNLDEWADKIEKCENYDRSKIQYLTRKDQYDIKEQVKKIENFFLS